MADAGNHFIRKLINLLLDKVPSLQLTSNILQHFFIELDQVSFFYLKCVCVCVCEIMKIWFWVFRYLVFW